jgi:hypothetical protein
MSNRPHFVSNPVTTAVPETANNTETVVNTLTGVIPEVASQAIKLQFDAFLTLGASSVGGTFRIRRGGLTGTLVGVAMPVTNLATAAGVTQASGGQEDTPGEGIFTYVLTYQGAGDTGVASITTSELSARWD